MRRWGLRILFSALSAFVTVGVGFGLFIVVLFLADLVRVIPWQFWMAVAVVAIVFVVIDWLWTDQRPL